MNLPNFGDTSGDSNPKKSSIGDFLGGFSKEQSGLAADDDDGDIQFGDEDDDEDEIDSALFDPNIDENVSRKL